MQDPKHLREQARICRALANTAIEPELIEQFRVGQSSLPTKPTRWNAPSKENRI